jgi:hypothetical protein
LCSKLKLEKISQGKLLWGEMVVLLDVTDKPEKWISCLVYNIICSIAKIGVSIPLC